LGCRLLGLLEARTCQRVSECNPAHNEDRRQNRRADKLVNTLGSNRKNHRGRNQSLLPNHEDVQQSERHCDVFVARGSLVTCDVKFYVVSRGGSIGIFASKRRRDLSVSSSALAVLYAFDNASQEWLETILLEKVADNNHVSASL